MDISVHVVSGLFAFVRSALTGTETVWLKDVTDRFQTPKRVFGEPDLPDQLTFHMRRRSTDPLKLTLKRNYEIDPNADIYFVEKTKDGRSIMSKSTTLETEAIAYYQDVDNGAYMTVRCINSLNKRCDRVISGNIQIGERSYDLRPVETDVTQRKVMEVRDINGRKYLLLDQTHILQEHFVQQKVVSNVNETHVKGESKVLFSPQENENKIRQQKHNYYVKVAICIDSGVWDLYFAKVNDVHPSRKRDEVKRRIREAYSHIMNGVNLRYKTIKDPSISISIIPFEFVYFLHEVMFPHKVSRVRSVNGIKYIDASQYLDDFIAWEKTNRGNDVPQFDHAMLFTTLGAEHDGVGEAAACKSEDLFLMATVTPQVNRHRTYIANIWTFSYCSIESFKRTQRNKQCVKERGSVYDTDEHSKFMKQLAGDVFTPQEQCYLVCGQGYVYHGVCS